MPDGTGFDLLREIRTGSRTPVIFLTARAEIEHVVEGLEGGADDYVRKPVQIPELVARVRTQLRRSTQLSRRMPDEKIVVGNILIDPLAREITVDGRPVSLTPKELGLLLLLAERPGYPVSRESLFDDLWEDGNRTPKILDVYVRRLRKKIEREPSRPRHLITVKGFGYKLSEED